MKIDLPGYHYSKEGAQVRVSVAWPWLAALSGAFVIDIVYLGTRIF